MADRGTRIIFSRHALMRMVERSASEAEVKQAILEGKRMTKLSYDEKADALYIWFKSTEVAHTVRVGPDLAIDYGPDGEIHGIELLSAREHLRIKKIPEAVLENIKFVKK